MANPTENATIVNDFCSAWHTMDVELILSFLTEDCFYHNVPMEPMVGTAPIRDLIKKSFEKSEAVEFMILFTATSPEGVVMNERIDRFKRKNKWLELPIMGVFELRNGKIAKWRDYFDLKQWEHSFK